VSNLTSRTRVVLQTPVGSVNAYTSGIIPVPTNKVLYYYVSANYSTLNITLTDLMY